MKKLLFLALAALIFSPVLLAACFLAENGAENTETENVYQSETQAVPEEITEPTEEQEEQTEINVDVDSDNYNIDEIKEYLRNNFDKFNIDGSTSMIPLHQSLYDLFVYNDDDNEWNEWTVYHNRTVEAFEKFISGENHILLGVDYSDELLERAENSGIDLAQKAITREAFVFLININNPVRSLTVGQIKDIYSGKITNWGEVGGDDAPVSAFQRNPDSGSQIRMIKFMGDTNLMETGVTYWSSMGHVIEQIADFDSGKYSIAYNMFTFTEKQYANAEVILLDVDGVYPDDDSIFDATYPIVIYNYIYYDANNTEASEFAEKLYIYLMSDEGQKLINDSGYVNLNINFDRNKDIDKIYGDDDYGHTTNVLGFYNEEKGEFYAIDRLTGGLLVFSNYADFVLRDTKYKDNANAREYLTLLSNSGLASPETWVSEADGTIKLDLWMTGAFDPEHFFNVRYNGLYYSDLTYFIDENRYALSSYDQDMFDEAEGWGYFNNLSEYRNNAVPGSYIKITREDLKNVYLRSRWERNISDNGAIEWVFSQPFK